MTYSARETSIESGAPIELYEFSVGFERFRYTSADKSVAWTVAEVFEPLQIDRSDIEETDELARANLNVTVPRDFPVAELFRVAPPSEVIALSIYRMHDGDTERLLYWTGRVLNASYEGVVAVLTCESLLTSLQRSGLRRLYQRQCPHVLYGTHCGVNESTFKVVTNILSFSGNSITSTLNALNGISPSGYFDGGFVQVYMPGGQTARRAIKTQVADTITLTHPISGLVNGLNMDVFPGCDHTLATCNSKFANSVNYGGMPYVPVKNPFGGTGL